MKRKERRRGTCLRVPRKFRKISLPVKDGVEGGKRTAVEKKFEKEMRGGF